jgi:hypothetical protein
VTLIPKADAWETKTAPSSKTRNLREQLDFRHFSTAELLIAYFDSIFTGGKSNNN